MARPVGIPAHNRIWTEDTILSEAAKHSSITSWRLASEGSYLAARRLGCVPAVTAHMKRGCRLPWTDQEIFAEARKYRTRYEWFKNSQKTYDAAQKRGLLVEASKHMRWAGNGSAPEQELLVQVRSVYPDAKRLTVKMQHGLVGRPYIKGFQVDVFVPALSKGIELDGEYWHSPDGLRRGRSSWPDEAISSYHQIKDSFFLQRGISIMHVGVRDWLGDRDRAWFKIKEFLI